MAAAGIVGTASPTEAAPSVFWPDYYEPYLPPRPAPFRVRKSIKKQVLNNEDLAKDARKPQGPLIIAISIEKQLLRIYDANGAFAKTPISTGMRGHSTPMGVFSVIQKRKYHRSNIYSGAPMPYMQRITWSGVAMHAGVLPGYPASHGCIRMPMNFAVKMWGWTRIGARVVIAPGELSPESFSHPLLATQKTPPTPVPVAAAEPNATVTAKSDKTAVADPAIKPALSGPRLGLKSTLGHDPVKSAASEAVAAAALREQIHTADASSAMSQPRSPLTITDAPVASSGNIEVATSDEKSGGTRSAQSTAAEFRPADVNAFDQADAADAGPDANKDQSGPSDPQNAAAPKPQPAAAAAAAKRSGQIAVFVSKKDGKLYVRQNFTPLFEVPVTIAPGERLLGTHLFTAQADKDDGNLLRWSVVSMPVVAHEATQPDLDERAARRRKTTGAVEVKAAPLPGSAAEALDRLTIPADAMARINDALSTGASIIVSDQGVNGGETGEGTDFIIPLR
ncbi:L,D-transpeptidase [Bradyrhizobium sp.]|uniref:L,D-transpeptidase n=1 Tax=Bradyrhizobium sp. TaxID=376 RepID=UPI002E016B53|nr:L,D-transpeptidase [Bradyrhizobium sp.]